MVQMLKEINHQKIKLLFRHFKSYPKKSEKKKLYGDMIRYSLMGSTQWSTTVSILKC